MKLLGRIIYEHKLAKIRSNYIPYEKMSGLYLWKLHNQVYYMDYGAVKMVKNFINIYVVIRYKSWKFRQGYYVKNGIKYNKYTDKPFYIHDEKGLYAYYPKKCRAECKFCKETVTTY